MFVLCVGLLLMLEMVLVGVLCCGVMWCVWRNFIMFCFKMMMQLSNIIIFFYLITNSIGHKTLKFLEEVTNLLIKEIFSHWLLKYIFHNTIRYFAIFFYQLHKLENIGWTNLLQIGSSIFLYINSSLDVIQMTNVGQHNVYITSVAQGLIHNSNAHFTL